MSKKKGLSVEEKRRIILDIYHTTKEVYNLKEIEQAASKRGVVSQSVKDVNQGLIDDGLVDSDKIGSGNFYWSFPSKALQQAKNAVQASESGIQRLKEDISTLERRVTELSASRQESEGRAQKMSEYQELLKLKEQNDKELERFKENDPELLQQTEAKIVDCKRAINRWTDNAFAVKSYLVKKHGMSAKEVLRMMQLPDDFDYIEE